jgi:GGDEF domain-containing protein
MGGFAVYPDDGATTGDLFRAADKSMYAYKHGASVA